MNGHAMESRELHRLLAKVHRMHCKCSSGPLAEIGITQGQPRILHHLSVHDGCIQKEFSRQFDLEPATVTNILSIMEDNGLVRREYDPADRRILRVFLTAKGRQAHARVEDIFASLEEVCFRGFPEQDKAFLVARLKDVYENLKKAQESKVP